jgi:hypothetical protein
MSDTVTFVASPKKAVLILLASIGFVALGVWELPDMPVLGWVTIAFFSLGVPTALVIMFSNTTYLRLDEEGFEMSSIVAKRKFKWTDVAAFRIGSISGARMIAIDFHPEYESLRRTRRVLGVLTGGVESAIPNQYAASLEQVLAALTEWRDRYGRRSA